jgi:Cu+-exporting ATPase
VAAIAERVDLELEGMTCAGCAARIEQSLNRLGGVDATVNFATERASVAFDPDSATVDDLVEAVEGAGYGAHVRGAPHEHGDDDSESSLRLTVAAALTIPLVVLAMAPGARFGGWEWLAFALSTPVVFWSGLGFHRTALAAARHRAATMDTLVSLGTLAAWAWSTVVLVGGLDADTYFEVAAVITTLILLGRRLEAIARRRSGAAIRALAEIGAKEARLLADGSETLVPVEQLRPGDRFVVRPGERVATDGIVEGGAASVDVSLLTGEPLPLEAGPGTELAGGTVNLDGRLVVCATHVGADTALARITGLVGGACAEREGARAASCRSHLRRLCAGRPGARTRDAPRLACGRPARVRGVHTRSGRSDHRVPVRARPGHADCAPRRDRPRRAARDPRQRARGARADPPHRHGCPRQDRDGHGGRHGARGRRASRRRPPGRGAAPRRRGRGCE